MLRRFLDDGRLVMTNNASERELRTITVGRDYAESLVMRSRRGRGGVEGPGEIRDCA